jgi:hypothetical protein
MIEEQYKGTQSHATTWEVTIGVRITSDVIDALDSDRDDASWR